MTGPQAAYLETLAREAGEEAPAELTKAEALRKQRAATTAFRQGDTGGWAN
jgi:hypothetical protein